MTVRKLWRLWGLLLVALVLAWLVMQSPGSSGDVQTVRATRHAARLQALTPLPRPADPASSLATLSESTMWGPLPPRAASGVAGGAESPPPKWSLTGFYERSGKRYVVVSFEQQARPSQQLKVADSLPDGSRIIRIETDRVRVRSPAAGNAAAFEWIPITPGLPMPSSRRQR